MLGEWVQARTQRRGGNRSTEGRKGSDSSYVKGGEAKQAHSNQAKGGKTVGSRFASLEGLEEEPLHLAQASEEQKKKIRDIVMATREKEGGKRTANQDVGLASKSSGSRQEAGEAMLQEDAPAGPNSHPKEMKVADKARTSKLRKMRENQAGATSPNTKKLMCQTPREEERANNDGCEG